MAQPHYLALIDQGGYEFVTHLPRTPERDALAWEIANKYAALRGVTCDGLYYVGVTQTVVPPVEP